MAHVIVILSEHSIRQSSGLSNSRARGASAGRLREAGTRRIPYGDSRDASSWCRTGSFDSALRGASLGSLRVLGSSTVRWTVECSRSLRMTGRELRSLGTTKRGKRKRRPRGISRGRRFCELLQPAALRKRVSSSACRRGRRSREPLRRRRSRVPSARWAARPRLPTPRAASHASPDCAA